VLADPSLARDEAKATVVFKDGTTRSSHVVQCRGSLTRQLTDAELQEKFLAQAVRSIPAAQAARVAELCWKLPALDDVGKQIGAALAP
jgi:hypothetical protein